jgi:hypothetical protein
MRKISNIKDSSKNVIEMNPMMPEESIDAGKSNGWRIKMQGGANDSFAYGVGESIMKPHNVGESNAIIYLKKDYTKRVRKYDVEKQQMDMMNREAEEVLEKTGVEMRQLEEAQKATIQGHQGAAQESKHQNNYNCIESSEQITETALPRDSIVIIPKSAFIKMELE